MSTRRRLVRERNELIRYASTRSIQAEGPELDENLRQIESYDKLIGYATPAFGSWLHAGVVALLCITVVGVAWTWPMSSNKVIVDVNADAIELRLAAAWRWKTLPAEHDALRLEQMDSVEVPGKGIDRVPPSLLTARPWVDVTGGTLSLNEFDLDEGATLRLHRADEGFVDVQTQYAPLKGQFSVVGERVEVKIKADLEHDQPDTYTIARAAPEALVFASEGTRSVPAKLRMRPKRPLVLSNLEVDEMSLLREVSEKPGHMGFVCTIKSGTLRFTDTEREFPLRKGDCLQMEDARGEVVQMTIDNVIELRFEGQARRVQIGPEKFQRDITPSYLEWLFYNQRLSFLWGAVIFLWGILWSARRMLVT